MNKLKVFKVAVDDLIRFSAGTEAESAPLDVYCEKVKITFGDPEKVVLKMCLLAWCGFNCRLEFAQLLIEKGASGLTFFALHIVYGALCNCHYGLNRDNNTDKHCQSLHTISLMHLLKSCAFS